MDTFWVWGAGPFHTCGVRSRGTTWTSSPTGARQCCAQGPFHHRTIAKSLGGRLGSMEPVLSAPPRLPRDERLLDAENLWSNVRPLAGGPAYTEIMCHGNKFGPNFSTRRPFAPRCAPTRRNALRRGGSGAVVVIDFSSPIGRKKRLPPPDFLVLDSRAVGPSTRGGGSHLFRCKRPTH